MKFRLHSTTEIDTPNLIFHLILLYSSNPEKAINIFQQGFKRIPFEVIKGVLEKRIPYTVINNIVIIDTKMC